AGDKTAFLLFVADLEPVFDQLNTAVDNEQLELGADLEKTVVLVVGAEAHDAFDAGPVVPAAVKDHDFTGRRKVRYVALQIQLSLLSIGRRRQRHDAEHARTDPLGDGLNRAALPGGVAAFEDHDDTQVFALDPVLQCAELDLELA